MNNDLDMEWLTSHAGSTSMEVDIGYISRMELKSTAPSISINETGIPVDQLINPISSTLYEHVLKPYQPMNDDSFLNEKQIFDLLEQKFYPFKQVKSLFRTSYHFIC